MTSKNMYRNSLKESLAILSDKSLAPTFLNNINHSPLYESWMRCIFILWKPMVAQINHVKVFSSLFHRSNISFTNFTSDWSCVDFKQYDEPFFFGSIKYFNVLISNLLRCSRFRAGRFSLQVALLKVYCVTTKVQSTFTAAIICLVSFLYFFCFCFRNYHSFECFGSSK